MKRGLSAYAYFLLPLLLKMGVELQCDGLSSFGFKGNMSSSHDDTRLSEVTVELGRLRITVSDRSGSSSRVTVSDESASSSAAPVPKAKAKAVRKQVKKFYAVLSCKRAPGLVGVHFCFWPELEELLPTGRLAGSGAVLKGFSLSAEAEEYWIARCEGDLVRHGY